ncbi:MAG: rhomboid family intramembrane serine protease [Candidatus Aminicenantes bacterium]|nr:rhomboid family intramembrane serine protease [Candidatus Aminicenantes bacterium]
MENGEMPLTPEAKPYVRSAFGKEERIYFLKAAALILVIYFFRSEIYDMSRFFLLFLPFFFFCYVWFKSIQTGDRLIDILKEHITFMPIPYAESGKKAFIPRTTVILILINILVFYLLSLSSAADLEFIAANFSFLPKHVTWWNILLSPFSSMFLHAGAGHLWGNMIVFWAFGPAVEERVGTGKFLFLYFSTGLLGSLLSVIIFRVFLSETFHSLGASGAIAGISGVFLVRCYFKKLVIPLPLLGLVNFKLKVNSLLPLGMFFLLDIRSGIKQLTGKASLVAYWVHVGSMVAGMAIAARLKLHGAAAEEKYTEVGLQALENTFSRLDGESALRAALELNPHNEAALLGMARLLAATRKPEGREFFQKAIRLKLRSEPRQAAEIYKEYMDTYNRMLEPDLQYRLAGVFYHQDDHEPAARSLEMVINEPSTNDDTRQRAFYQLVLLLAENNMLEAAHYRLQQFGEQYPGCELAKAAELKFVEVLKS